MKRLRTLVLAAMAAMAASVVLAVPSASAMFQLSTAPAKVTATSIGKSVVNFGGSPGNNLTCDIGGMNWETWTSTVETMPFTPTFSNCVYQGKPTSIESAGCDFHFVSPYAGEGSFDHFNFITEQKSCIKLKIPALGWYYELLPQTGLTSVTYTNVGSGVNEEVIVKVQLTKVAYRLANSEPMAGGTFTAEFKLAAAVPGGQVSIQVVPN